MITVIPELKEMRNYTQLLLQILDGADFHYVVLNTAITPCGNVVY